MPNRDPTTILASQDGSTLPGASEARPLAGVGFPDGPREAALLAVYLMANGIGNGIVNLSADLDSALTHPAAGNSALNTLSRPLAFVAGENAWRRVVAVDDNTDNQASEGATGNNVLMGVLSRLQGYDPVGNNWDRLRIGGDNADAIAAAALGELLTLARNTGFNGATWDRLRTASAAVQAVVSSKVGVQVAAKQSDWGLANTPAANTIATVTRAAGGVGTRHIITGLAASVFDAAGTLPLQRVRITSGAEVWTVYLGAQNTLALNAAYPIALSDLSIVCPDNTAVTMDFTTVPGANNFQTVSLQGYTA